MQHIPPFNAVACIIYCMVVSASRRLQEGSEMFAVEYARVDSSDVGEQVDTAVDEVVRASK